MGARQTMSTAQRLYEAGHITYMRTDGIDMAPEAVSMARDTIKEVERRLENKLRNEERQREEAKLRAERRKAQRESQR